MSLESLRRQALGRIFPLGTLYDVRRDVFVSDSRQCDSFTTDAPSVHQERRCSVKHTCEDSFTSRCDLLDVEANLRANLLLFETGVSGEFLLKSNQSHKTVTAALSVCFETVKEALPDSAKKKLENFWKEKASIDEQATHVVVGVQWGARATVELSTTTTSHVKEAQSIHERLRSIVALTAKNLNESYSGSVFQTDVSEDFFKAFNFEVYGDVIAPSRKLQTINEVLGFLSEVPKLVGCEKGIGIPLSYELLPLGVVRGKGVIQSPSLLNARSVSDITDCYDRLQHENKTQTDQLQDAEDLLCYLDKTALDEIADLRKETDSIVERFRAEMRKIRESELISGKSSRQSWNSTLNEWLSRRQKALPWLADILALHEFLRQKGIHVLKSSEQLEEVVSRFKSSFRDVYVLFTTLPKVTLDSFRHAHEDFIKLSQNERHIADLLLVDTNVHLRHQDSKGTTKHYCHVNFVRSTGHSDINTRDTDSHIPFWFRCPGLRCPSDLLAWKCCKCYTQVAKNKSFICCSCGSAEETDCFLKCSHKNHGSEYTSFPVDSQRKDVELFCEACDDGESLAKFFCTECKDHQYYCEDCASNFHRKGKPKNHAYQNLFSSPSPSQKKLEDNPEENWKKVQGNIASKEAFYSLMVGKQSVRQLSAVLNLENLLEDENSEEFLEGSVAFGRLTEERLRQAVRENKEKGVGLIASLLTSLLDSLIRRERLSTFTELLCHYNEISSGSDVPEIVLDLTAKDVAIALLETVPDDTKRLVMRCLHSVGYPLPLCYVMHRKQATQQSSCVANFGVLSLVLPGSTSPLVLSCGTFNTIGKGKTFLFRELISKLSSSIDIDLLDDGGGPTHNSSVDLILEKEGKGDFNYVDIHGWNTDSLQFADVVATLASVSYLILLHVSEDDVRDLKSQKPSAVRFLLKEQLRSAPAVLVVLIRDTEDERLREEAEAAFREAFPSGRDVVLILVNNLKSEKGSRLDRAIKTILHKLETFFNAPQEKELRAEKLRCPPSEYLVEAYKAERRDRSPPSLRLRTSLGEALFKALTNTYEKNRGFFSKLFPITTIKSKIAETHATEKEIIDGFAKNKPKHEKYIKECEEERRRLKMKRVQIANVAEPLKLFANVIRSNDAKGFAEFQYYLEEWKSRHVDNLYKKRQELHDEIKRLRMKQDSREASDRMLQAQKEYQENSSALDEIDVSVDSFWSEIMHMYNLEAKMKSQQLTTCCALAPETVRKAYLDYLKQGFAIQLLQGKPLQMAGQFMRDILSELDRQESSNEEKDMIVVSVIGEQSSGKSTLLNSLFGCGFSTAAGKCTKGLFASYLKLSSNKSLLVLDSEGLLSIEGGGRVFDGQITLLALACSDLVIINHKGEISSELNDLLQVCLYAMATLKVAKIKPSVAFVLRDQRECRNERVHQTALLKMQEAIRKAVSTSPKDVDDLIEIGSDSLFLLHSAFSETIRGSRSIEIPSLKFSRETFRLRKRIIESLEKERKNCNSSRPLSDWYTNARYVWKTVTKHGHSLLYCKTVHEIQLRQELGDFANEVVRKGLDDESKGFKMLARGSFNKFLKELNSAESEETINRVGRDFNGELEAIMESAIKGLQHQFDQMAAGTQYEEFKTSFKNSLRVPVRHEYDFEREKWKMKEDHRKQELHLTLTSRFFLESTKDLLKKAQFQRGVSTEEAEALFIQRWKEYEPKAMARLGVKKSEDETRAEVYGLFAQVAASTNYKVGGRPSLVTVPQKKLFSKESGLFFEDQDWWAKYVHIIPSKEKKQGRFSKVVNRVINYFTKSEKAFVHDNLETIKAEVENIVNDLVFSLAGSNPQPFGHKLVKQTIDEAVLVTEKAEKNFSSKDGFQFLTTQFMTDFVITLLNESVESLLTQQKKNEEKAKKKLLEDKKDQHDFFLAVVSRDKTDMHKAKALAKLYEKAINLFIEAELGGIKVTVKESVNQIFGHNHKAAALRAYDESFGSRDFENVVMYCIDAERFLYNIYSKILAVEQTKIKKDKGEQLIVKVDLVYAQLVKACQSWQKEVTESDEWSESTEGWKPVVKLSDFEKRLKESSDISEDCLRTFPELVDYKIGRVEVLCPSLCQELEEIRKKVVCLLRSRKIRKTLDDQKRFLWLTQLKGCRHVCPKCGVKCEGETNHTGSHTVTEKLHVFPSFHQWGFIKEGKTYIYRTMCLDPETRKHYHIRGKKRWENLDDFLKEEHPDWLPFTSNPKFADPRPEIKEAWVNCRRALLYLRNRHSDPENCIIDDTPQDWIDTYEIKERLVTEDDVDRLKRKLQEEI